MRWIALLFVIGCGTSERPTSTGTTCADPTGASPLTWQNFGYDFMCHYCTNCHDSGLTISQRNGSPLFHDLDTLSTTMEVALHTDQQAGWGPKAHNNFMPGGGTDGRCPSVRGGRLDHDCNQPTGEERTNLAQYLACQKLRQSEITAPDAGVSDHCARYTGPPQ